MMKKENKWLSGAIGDALSEKYREELALCEENSQCSPRHYKKMSRILGFRVGNPIWWTRAKKTWAAAILAAAMLLTGCMLSIFQMDNTLSFANTYSENKTAIHNFHKVEDLGGADLTMLTGTDMTQHIGGSVYFDMVTTSRNVTYLVVSYVEESTPKAEFTLYRANKDGWEAVDTRSVGLFTASGPEYHHLIASGITLLCDNEDNLYVVSAYEEGVQIHQYTKNGRLVRTSKQKVADARIIEHAPGYKDGNWFSISRAIWDETTGDIAILLDASYSFIASEDGDESCNEICFVTYTPSERAFAEPLYFDMENSHWTLELASDNKGGYYFLRSEQLEPYYPISWLGTKNRGAYLYHLSNGVLVKGMLVTDEKESVYAIRLFDVDESGAIHVVYSSRGAQYRPDRMLYTKVENNAVVDAYPIVSGNKVAHPHDYISFYRVEDRIYFAELADLQRILFSWTSGGGQTYRLAEFELPEQYDTFDVSGSRLRSFVSQGNIVNFILVPAWLDENTPSVQEMYFGQIICDYEIP